MKIMSRDFTTSEKILILLLALILLGLMYYYFIELPVRDAINSTQSDIQMYQSQIDAAQQRIARLKAVQEAIDNLEAEGKNAWMASYNNSKAEVAFLNDILAETVNYSISFADVTRNGDQIRRSFTLQYMTEDYESAQAITRKLCNSKDRCLVSNITCNIAEDGRVTINEMATFYETMVGGTPDDGLPSDKATANR